MSIPLIGAGLLVGFLLGVLLGCLYAVEPRLLYAVVALGGILSIVIIITSRPSEIETAFNLSYHGSIFLGSGIGNLVGLHIPPTVNHQIKP